MTRNYIALSLAAALGSSSLAGCATNPAGGGIPQIDQATLNSVEAQVQSAVHLACGFVPTIGSVAGIVATFVGGGAVIDLVSQAAKAICAAVTAVPVVATASGKRRLARVATVNGVAIQGYFTR